MACVKMVYVRKGQHIGDKTFFPNLPQEHTPEAVLEAFIAQYYLERDIPREILLSHTPGNLNLLKRGLEARAHTPVVFSTRLRGERLKWLEMAFLTI